MKDELDLKRRVDAISKRKKACCRRMLGSAIVLYRSCLTCVVYWKKSENRDLLIMKSVKGGIFLFGTRC